jgi:hypothetical protein
MIAMFITIALILLVLYDCYHFYCKVRGVYNYICTELMGAFLQQQRDISCFMNKVRQLDDKLKKIEERMNASPKEESKEESKKDEDIDYKNATTFPDGTIRIPSKSASEIKRAAQVVSSYSPQYIAHMDTIPVQII